MSKEKLILTKEDESKASMPVFIDADLHEKLLELKKETKIPLRRIVEKMIRFSIDNVVIEESE
ncbi:ribbon-helix-helix domain-containing protein [Listeria booriae]|uniref:ribbon-helix-helix domain-containing protein n=1 Tax=Listeria booriae TaxID=1552123 RepID=UPI00162A4605|nr:ribbon-helix-helix domain-containing protein [Listeria booriae]MBC1233674.1 ribbon-helix-helix domain-containing protein [Listeria booriae]MBC2263738.1 ribbon-helix-helix domain-containing protein [Listeria booriae]